MKAIGYTKQSDELDESLLTAFSAETPELRSHDVLVSVKAVSVNPVDTKVRQRFPVEGDTPKIIGYDAAGIVMGVGSDVRNYKVGDEVFYAGDIMRAGSNATLQAVDERIIGKKPKNLNYAEAAAVPLTAITAWEILFDSLRINEGEAAGESILIIGGAGGVGSILIQLAKQLTDLKVIATASRPETIAWVKKMGADIVVNHRQPLDQQLAELGVQPKYVAALTGTDGHFEAIIELIKPRGHIAIIDDPKTLDISAGKQKALSFSWEFMFTRPMFQTEDMQKQRDLLNRVSKMLENGDIVTTMTENLGVMSVETLNAAHRIQASGRVIGKNVLEVEG